MISVDLFTGQKMETADKLFRFIKIYSLSLISCDCCYAIKTCFISLQIHRERKRMEIFYLRCVWRQKNPFEQRMLKTQQTKCHDPTKMALTEQLFTDAWAGS